MNHTLKIHGRGIGRVSETLDIIIELIKEHPEKNRLHIIANNMTHQGYLFGLKKRGFEIEILEENGDSLVVKLCKK
jgi:hypothetical protein